MAKRIILYLLCLFYLSFAQGYYSNNPSEEFRSHSQSTFGGDFDGEIDKRSFLPPENFYAYDYEDNRDKRGTGTSRTFRYGIAATVENGKTYSVQNLKDKLYLTAKTGRSNPSPVVMTKFSGGANQLWKVTNLGNGVSGKSLKSLKNEFNKVTSRLDFLSQSIGGVSHSFVPWQIQEYTGKVPRGLEDYNPFTISHKEGKAKFCLQSNGLLREVSRVQCNPLSPAQLWAFRDETDNDESNRL